MILLFTIGQSLLPTIASAQELNTTGFVDNFTINKTELRYGDRTTINVNFSDKSGNNMKSGDTLTLALPNELIGFNTTIPLDDEQGNNFGICKVNSTNVVCEFNEIVEKLHNIRGHFNFTVQASNVEIDQTIEVETNLGTNLEKQTVTITGPTSGGTGSGERPFFQKGGSIYPENTSEVQWILSVNPNSEQLNTDIVLYDSLQEGQLLNKDSFSMYVNDKVYLTLIDFEAQGYGSITFMDNNSFKLVFNKDKASGNKFSIGYKSTITEEGKKQEFFENDYKIEYQVVNKETSVDSNSVKVENISFGGGAEGDLPPKGTLRIIKHIAANEEKVIPNVTFKLFKELGEQVGDKYTTNGQGVIEIPNLLPGNYYVQEVSAPDYVTFDPQAKVSFEVKANAINGIKLLISNEMKTTSIRGTKSWNDNNSPDRPKTIKVDLLQNGKVIDTKEVSEATEWKYAFTDLVAYDAEGKAYKYEVKEQPVAGYQTEVNGYDITNTKVGQTKVEGTKKWKDGDGKGRPETIKVDLLQNGQVIATQEVSAKDEWKYTFVDLVAYDAEGKAYKYEVKEQ
ncbi:Cna B-type domain-containing protein, partial [Bacillus cereus]|nr:Cna B-type domain-containing protein [Bacillus cereus]